MTKTLQKKFVVTAMAAITVLLLLLLGVINVVNSVLVSGEIQRTLEIIWQSEGGEGLLPPPDPAPRGPGEGPKNAHDTVLSSNYFLVHYDQEGAVAKVDVSRTSAVTEEVAQELAAQACAGEREEGRLSRFRYLRREAPQGGVTLVFFGHLRGGVLLHPGVAALGGGRPRVLGADAGGRHSPIPAGHPAPCREHRAAKAICHQRGPRDQNASGHHPVQHGGYGTLLGRELVEPQHQGADPAP